ncbi:hypothetical protein D1953_00780 [Peribacillus asahii]|uniref:Uncharacterized protein n=1 Tax=Peribacillus asahii TaxID=228899 RepID=A0A398BFI8_9BACI|nr:hypothetical protein [Peribacillus asahii]RID89139.1 hypothetical protein D1953_00780 [Peribacillus asahii]
MNKLTKGALAMVLAGSVTFSIANVLLVDQSSKRLIKEKDLTISEVPKRSDVINQGEKTAKDQTSATNVKDVQTKPSHNTAAFQAAIKNRSESDTTLVASHQNTERSTGKTITNSANTNTAITTMSAATRGKEATTTTTSTTTATNATRAKAPTATRTNTAGAKAPTTTTAPAKTRTNTAGAKESTTTTAPTKTVTNTAGAKEAPTTATAPTETVTNTAGAKEAPTTATTPTKTATNTTSATKKTTNHGQQVSQNAKAKAASSQNKKEKVRSPQNKKENNGKKM